MLRAYRRPLATDQNDWSESALLLSKIKNMIMLDISILKSIVFRFCIRHSEFYNDEQKWSHWDFSDCGGE